jgi:hypothetical protein
LLLQGAIVTILALVFVVPNTCPRSRCSGHVRDPLHGHARLHVRRGDQARRSSPTGAADQDPAVQLVAVVGILASLSAIVLGLTPPSGYGSTSALTYGLLVAAGVIILAIPPQFIYRFRRPAWTTDPESIGAEPDA